MLGFQSRASSSYMIRRKNTYISPPETQTRPLQIRIFPAVQLARHTHQQCRGMHHICTSGIIPSLSPHVPQRIHPPGYPAFPIFLELSPDHRMHPAAHMNTLPFRALQLTKGRQDIIIHLRSST